MEDHKIDNSSLGADSLFCVFLETKTHSVYLFPDLTREMLHELLQTFDEGSDQLVARNISGSVQVVPARIVQSIGLTSHTVKAALDFTECTYLRRAP